MKQNMSSSQLLPYRFVLPDCRLDRDTKALLVKEIEDRLFGGSIKDEKKLKTEFVKESEGSKSQGTKDEDLENGPEKKRKIKELDCYFASPHPPDYYIRQGRAQMARHFTDRYKFFHGEKICVHPYGPSIVCPSEYCLKPTWVGVYGMQSICIVTCRDMDMTCLPAFYQRDCMKQQNMEMFAKAAISEVECLPHEDVDYYDFAFRRSCTGIVKKPFVVVSPGQGTHGEFCCEGSEPLRCCVLKTIEYLESVVSSDSLHTNYGIIRVALKAYQVLCDKELRADDIWVTIMEDFKPYCHDHLPMDVIGEQLDLVNGRSTEKDPQKPLIIKYRGSL